MWNQTRIIFVVLLNVARHNYIRNVKKVRSEEHMLVREKFNWNLLAGITFIFLSIAGIIMVPYQVLEPKIGIRSIAFSPSTFPYISLSLVALFSILIVFQTIFRKLGSGSEELVTPPKIRVIIPMAIFCGYVFIIEFIGMFVATLIAVALIALALGNRNWLTVVFLSSITSLCIWLFFSILLQGYFPEGVLYEKLT